MDRNKNRILEGVVQSAFDDIKTAVIYCRVSLIPQSQAAKLYDWKEGKIVHYRCCLLLCAKKKYVSLIWYFAGEFFLAIIFT